MTAALSILGACSRAWPALPAHRGIETEFEALWPGRFRKIGRFIKLALSAAALTMKHAGLTKLPAARTGVFLGTGLGNLADLVPFVQSLYDGQSIPSPIQFANSVGNSGAFYIAQAYALEGPVLAICQDEVSFEAAVLNAALLLRAGEIDLALVGGLDVFVPPASEQRARLGLDVADESVVLGEGVGCWLLSSAEGQGYAQLLDVTLKNAPAPRRSDGIAPPGIFPTSSAFAAGAFVVSDAAPGALYQAFSATREGLLGTITVRKSK